MKQNTSFSLPGAAGGGAPDNAALGRQLAEALLAAMGAGGTPLALAPEMAEAYQARLRDFHEKV